MKFEIHRDKDDDFIMLKNDSRCCICIYKDCSPDDFDAERACRMIQSMEELFESLTDSKTLFGSDYREKWGDFLNRKGRLAKIADFIEHGDKEETIFVGYFSDDIRDTRIKRIPKSEAIRLGLIDKEN